MSTRRCQQDAVYAAEREAHALIGKTWLGTLDDVRWFVSDHLTKSRWYLELVASSISKLTVERSPYPYSFASNPKEGEAVLNMSRLQCDQETVVHELSHCVSRAVNGSKSHDPWFVRTQLEITYYVIGPNAYSVLADAYTRHGVQVADRGIVWQRKGLIAL